MSGPQGKVVTCLGVRIGLAQITLLLSISVPLSKKMALRLLCLPIIFLSDTSQVLAQITHCSNPGFL